MKPRVLIIDDDPGVRFGFTKYLNGMGYDVIDVSCLAEAEEALSSESFDVILLDLNLPDGSGLTRIDSLRITQPDVAIVVITGIGDIPTAVEAMRRGADNFLTKPANMTELDIFLKKSLEVKTLRRNIRINGRLLRKYRPFFGESVISRKTLELASLAAENESVVILQGETGTGKGVLARHIHEHSARCNAPFVEINCSNLRGDLLASELFGHARGAFTTAVQDRQGLIEAADQGTLFLDEIGDMDLSVQANLLKVIEDKQYRRLGEVKLKKSNFRLICATNKDLAKETEEKRFRQDLYFRIFVFTILMPPLRDIPDDLTGFVNHFLGVLNAPGVGVPAEIMDIFKAYSWPGNLRELRNVLERALLLSRGNPFTTEHFPGLMNHTPQVLSEGADAKLVSLALDHIRNTVQSFGGDTIKAAKALGISRATLYRKLNKTI